MTLIGLVLFFGCTSSNSQKVVNKTSLETTKQPKNLDLGAEYCFYDSITQKITCGRSLILVKEGKLYEVNNSADVPRCGLSGLEDMKTNETYFIYIFQIS